MDEAAGLTMVAAGLRAPEGPVWLPDGDVLVCEMAAGRIARVSPDGRVSEAAALGGSPNGAQIGPDGALYVCNRGQTFWREMGDLLLPDHGRAELRGGGAIQRVDLATRAATTLYDGCDGVALNGPNDIVFDAHGGFYFTDFGHIRARDRDIGSVHYATADGRSIRVAAHGLDGPNGCALSPDGEWLYVSETFSNFVWRWNIRAPGELLRDPRSMAAHGGSFVAGPGGFGYLDSMAMDADGWMVVARVLAGHLLVISPDGELATIAMPDLAPTNVCFGGADLRTAYVTLMTSGRLAAVPWPRPGLALAFPR